MLLLVGQRILPDEPGAGKDGCGEPFVYPNGTQWGLPLPLRHERDRRAQACVIWPDQDERAWQFNAGVDRAGYGTGIDKPRMRRNDAERLYLLRSRHQEPF